MGGYATCIRCPQRNQCYADRYAGVYSGVQSFGEHARLAWRVQESRSAPSKSAVAVARASGQRPSW
eukprot:4408288-Pleurochrysis_carterae.AAC.1